MKLAETPTLLAKLRSDIPLKILTSLKRAPISMVLIPLKILGLYRIDRLLPKLPLLH